MYFTMLENTACSGTITVMARMAVAHLTVEWGTNAPNVFSHAFLACLERDKTER